eukprot:4679881-Pyramimonas_sp.AAC.1
MQEILELHSRRVPGIGLHNALYDGRPAPPLHPLIHAEYLDNFVSLSQSLSAVQAAADQVSQQLSSAPLPVHPCESSVGGATL